MSPVRNSEYKRDPILQKDRKRGTHKDTPVMRAKKHGQRISQAEAERAEAKKVSAREAEQPEQAEREDLGEAGETERED